MWRIADDGGIEQSDGSLLHQRTHALDQARPVDYIARRTFERPLHSVIGRSVQNFTRRIIGVM